MATFLKTIWWPFWKTLTKTKLIASNTNNKPNINNPVYNNLTIYQLRSYFSWRTLIRNKLYKQTEQSYVFLYIYELLNKIGVKNEIDGLNKIIDLWQNYRVFDNSFDKYLSNWVKDYYIINRINIDFNLIEEEFPIKNNDNLSIGKVCDSLAV